jgi:hypothetical protein
LPGASFLQLLDAIDPKAQPAAAGTAGNRPRTAA